MNYAIITTTNIIPAIISGLFIIISLVILFLCWYDTIKRSDPMGAVVSTFISLILCGIVVPVIPVKTHIQYLDITKFQVTQTDKFIKLYQPNTTIEIYTTTDYYLITNFKDFNVLEHAWNTNIYGMNAIGNTFTPVKFEK